MSTFKAFRVHNQDGKINSRFEQMSIDHIGNGNAVIKAAYSNINYKDALAATGAGRIMRRFPLVAGIDTAGYVQSSEDSRFKEGGKEEYFKSIGAKKIVDANTLEMGERTDITGLSLPRWSARNTEADGIGTVFGALSPLILDSSAPSP
jgi:hypothetical protein